jgi:hypothetical protein
MERQAPADILFVGRVNIVGVADIGADGHAGFG